MAEGKWLAWVQNPDIEPRQFARSTDACRWVVEMVRDPAAHGWGFVKKATCDFVALYRGETGCWV